MAIGVDWTHGAAHMWANHKVTVTEANEAVADIGAVWFDPDPHSYWGANGWECNTSDWRLYERGE